ncbi:uracil-DNA glycosylase [Methylacidiphilum kamchatkense Kam1]|uniref:Type-4 uracil-DNA glycosylase n=1 Tax=Methylacidiphilum kamchatkense Kam1 TaxID=1202785 RepID=A0A0C1UQ25_9BACT|nr:uracil-DNA glycosylase [Methylacidiphilum kamchatkense]KIE57943.1 uracil-DNA glycosylase [Methylacidiphilum kamchatkense Kam1]QDQ42372.1 DNA polymerase [Methylacidiphilum kamchatkense Kam1]
MEKINHGKIQTLIYKYLEILQSLGYTHLFFPRTLKKETKQSVEISKTNKRSDLSSSLHTSYQKIIPKEKVEQELNLLKKRVENCQSCQHLVAFRTQTVFGSGNPSSKLMFVGEAPGAEEDQQGEPFVGPAGQLLTKMIKAMGLSRDQVYIANVLKCRPDIPKGQKGNRKPTPEEMATCLPYLLSQIRLINPKVIVALGATAYEGLTGKIGIKISEVRGKFIDFNGAFLIATYHPSYLLHNPSLANKRKVWEDMLAVMSKLQMPISEKQKKYFLS